MEPTVSTYHFMGSLGIQSPCWKDRLTTSSGFHAFKHPHSSASPAFPLLPPPFPIFFFFLSWHSPSKPIFIASFLFFSTRLFSTSHPGSCSFFPLAQRAVKSFNIFLKPVPPLHSASPSIGPMAHLSRNGPFFL